MKLALIGVLLLTACATTKKVPPEDDAHLQAEVESRALQFFIDQANPVSGLVRDRAENFRDTPATERVASIASTGFGMAVIANAAKRGMVTPEFAKAYVEKTLKFAQAHIGRHKGWMFHFVDWETGAQAYQCEYSTIDTALFMAGALYAAQVLNDKAITTVAYQLYNDLDFADMMTDGGTQPKKKTLSMAYWNNGSGYAHAQWDGYAEQMILVLLGLGHPTHPLPVESWLAWDRKVQALPNGTAMMGVDGALFVHQYSQLFVDFRTLQDGFPSYFVNSMLATQWQRQLRREKPDNGTLAAGFWGFSAGEAPEKKYVVWDAVHFDTITCIGCAVASAMFMPAAVMQDIRAWKQGPYAAQIWGRYGLTDSVDIAHPWFSPTVLGITVGPEYLSLANTRTETSVWADFMKIPAIQTALTRAGTAMHGLASQGQ
jgi:hypothetical protein